MRSAAAPTNSLREMDDCISGVLSQSGDAYYAAFRATFGKAPNVAITGSAEQSTFGSAWTGSE